MAEYEYDLGVIGGGAAGLSVAAGASQLGVKTVLVERENKLGGDCLHYGCVPSKTLIKSARVRHQMATAARFGLPELELPPVDFGRIAARIKNVVGAIQHHDSEERFCSLGVRVLNGAAYFMDANTVSVGGETVSAAKWVVATGSSPAIPAVHGLAEVPYITNTNIFSLEELPESLCILGGGPIAVEMAQAFQRLGSRVSLIQRSDRILTNEDADMAAIVQDALSAEGVRIETGTKLLSVSGDENEVQVIFEQGGEEKKICASKLMVALGRVSNVDGLGLDNAGVEYSAKGIVVDARMRTSAKHIFAAGDVVGRHLFTHAAGYEAGIVIANAVFRIPRKADYTWLPHCTYTEPELAGMGKTQAQAEAEGLEHRVIEEYFADNDRAQAEGATEGKIKLVLGKNGKPLGIHICGMHAGDLLGEWVAFAAGNMSLSTLAGAVHPYPTLSEIGKKIAGKVISEKLFSDNMLKTLNFIFDHRGRACGVD